MAENPYDEKKNEGDFHSWQAGYGASSEMECPYSNDDGHLLTSWMKGYRTKLKEIGAAEPEPETTAEKPKTAPQKDAKKPAPKATTSAPKAVSLEDFSVEDLKRELHKRQLIEEYITKLQELNSIGKALKDQYDYECEYFVTRRDPCEP